MEAKHEDPPVAGGDGGDGSGDSDCQRSPSGNAPSQTDTVSEMAADIAALRAIVVAAARHFNVDMSAQGDGPVAPAKDGNIDFDAVKPKEGCYDEEITVRCQVNQLPTEKMFGSNWWGFLNLKRPRTGDISSPAPWIRELPWPAVPVFAWRINRSISADFVEFGYTADGDICRAKHDAKVSPPAGRPTTYLAEYVVMHRFPQSPTRRDRDARFAEAESNLNHLERSTATTPPASPPRPHSRGTRCPQALQSRAPGTDSVSGRNGTRVAQPQKNEARRPY